MSYAFSSRSLSKLNSCHSDLSWDWQYYYPLAAHIKDVWQRLLMDDKVSGQYDLEWGGDWASFKDGPHWQLNGK